MPSQNGLGVTSYRSSSDTTRFVEGQITDLHGAQCRTYRNPNLPQVSTITIASYATDADSVQVSITRPDGVVVALAAVVRESNVPVDDAAAAAAVVLLVNASASLNGHVEATSNAGVVTLTFQHPGLVYTVATTVVACTATVATSQTAGGSAFPLGRFTAAGTSVEYQPALRALTTTDTDDNVVGIVARPDFEYANAGSVLPGDTDSVPVGDLANVVYDGVVAMRNNGSVASAPNGQVWAVVSTTGGDEIGEARADGSGVAQVATLTAVADHQVYSVKAGVRINGELRELTFKYGPTDGTTTTDVAIDGLEPAAAAAIIAQGFTGIIAASSASAAATMTLTLTAGYAFEYVDGDSFGEDTAAESVTVSVATLAQYAIPLNRRRFYWVEAVAAGAIGRVMCRA